MNVPLRNENASVTGNLLYGQRISAGFAKARQKCVPQVIKAESSNRTPAAFTFHHRVCEDPLEPVDPIITTGTNQH